MYPREGGIMPFRGHLDPADAMSRATTRSRLIVNADDFGYSELVTTSIREALSLRRITSATILANGAAADQAIATAAAFPACSFGVHLNLTEFRPLTSSATLRDVGLVDQEGVFLGEAFRRLRPSPGLLQACYDELDAQLQSVMARGLRPSHLDSHHHIHTVAWLLPVIWLLMRRHRIFRLRNTMDIYSLHSQRPPSRRLLAAKQIWRAAARWMGARMPDHFTSVSIFLENPYRAAFAPGCSIEVMCHPGQAGFEQETALLLSQPHSPFPSGFELVSYCNIPA